MEARTGDGGTQGCLLSRTALKMTARGEIKSGKG